MPNNTKDRRYELHLELESILESNEVYFQPPESIRMHYPAIVYTTNRYDTFSADDSVYNTRKSYTVTVMYTNPDSILPNKILSIDKCSFDRHYVSDNLYHDVFTIYE